MAEQAETQDLWLFGYGSLIWKPPPHYDLRLPGYIEGYVRRFWQASEDHRGTPESPGRVVTLIDRQLWSTLTDEHPSAPPRVWGAAYRIPAAKVPEVTAYMNMREINGYSIQYTPFHHQQQQQQPKAEEEEEKEYQNIPGNDDNEKKPIKCLIYIALPNNPQFLGPQNPQKLAEHIMKSRGPSGENREYLYELEAALDGLSSPHPPESGDDHISDLARRCREFEIEVGLDLKVSGASSAAAKWN